MKPSRSPVWPWILLAVLTLLLVGGLGLSFLGSALGGASVTGPRVALIEVSGPITDEGVRGFFGGAQGGARAFIEEVEAARKDDNIKAVVIRVNSPGGSASASQEMYQAVRRLQDKKYVVCSMGDVAASGGYYIAAGCSKIYANAATLTGSIGVISQFLNYQGLFRKLGLDEATLKSGKFKDAGNPARPLTPEEKQLFQKLILSIYGQFVTDVVQGRSKATSGKLTRARLLPLADGRVYTGQQAKNNLLIDQIGGLHEAIADAAKAGGIEGEPVVGGVKPGGGLGGLLGAETSGALSALSRGAGEAFAQGFSSRLKAELKTETRDGMPSAR